MDKLVSLNKGIRRQPSVGADGELSECVNLIPRGGELVNVRGMEEAGITLTDGDTYVGSIKTNMYRDVHIAYNDKTIKYVMTDKGADTVNFGEATEIEEKERIERCLIMGNSLVYYCPTAKYLVLRGDSFVQFEDYVKNIDLTFGLQSEVVEKEEDAFTKDRVASTDIASVYATESGMGKKAVELVNSQEKKGKFVNPFFVRYAFRMFDGSVKGQSSPVLMPCCDKYGVVALVSWSDTTDVYVDVTYKTTLRCFAHELYYRAVGDTLIENIKDLVLGVDIFFCPVTFTREVNGEQILIDWNTNAPFSFSSTKASMITDYPFEKKSMSDRIDGEEHERYSFAFWDEALSNIEIRECSTFFKLCTIPLLDIVSGSYAKVNVKDLTVLGDSMTDGYYDHYRYKANAIFSYNNRIFRGGLESVFRKRYQLPVHVGCSSVFPADGVGSDDETWNVYLEVEKDGDKTYVDCGSSSLMKDAYVPYLFVPYPHVKKMVLYRANPEQTHEIAFSEHAFLHGSYAYNHGDNLLNGDGTVPENTLSNVGEMQPNVVQLSEEGNMFMYSPLNEFVVGDGEILAFSTATTALSEGQFGAFPVYVFCTDGIWVLEIAADGTVSSVKPVSRDVCNNPESITQVDNAVVFTTNKGLMMLSGAEAVLLSDVLNGHNVKESDYWPKGFFAGQGEDEGFDALVQDETRDIRDILRHCTISYDYANQLLRIFPEDDGGGKPYKYYVFSLESREYATVISDEGVVSGVVAGYPSSMVQIGTKLYRPKERDDEEVKLGMLLTRPMTLDEPYALKKLMDLKLHYRKHDGTSRFKVMMHVSNDGAKWMRLTGLRKRSYKYYRFSIITKMKDMDALSGIVLRYDLERANRMR